jgi:hypothetical protein
MCHFLYFFFFSSSSSSSQVHLDTPVIVNGVSVRWKGFINLEKLDGVGGFRFDEDAARIEDIAMQQQERKLDQF